MRNKIIFFLVISLSCLLSCKDDTKFNKTIELYNIEIAKAKEEQSEWIKNPVSIVVKLASSDFSCDKTVITVKKINKGETAEKVNIILEEEGQISHESSDFKQTYTLERLEDNWVFIP